LKSSKLKGTVP